MNAAEYRAWKTALGWTYARIALELGIGERTAQGYAEGRPIPEPVARLIRLTLNHTSLGQEKPQE
jgi:transcriptional regulator with XRE-family HTH domain